MTHILKHLTADDITDAILTIRNHWLSTGLAESIEQAHRGEAPGGSCVTLVRELNAKLREDGFDLSDFHTVDVASFQVSCEDDDPGRPLDRKLLKKHWPHVKPTHGLDWNMLERLSEDAGWDSGTHMWSTFEGKHYDSECPHGVENFLELPFFERCIVGWLEEKNPELLSKSKLSKKNIRKP